jgi:aspartate kinase
MTDMTGRHSVEKIGGTSMAATDALFDNVLIGTRKGRDLYNRIFVVSAYAGMTDLLLEHKKTGAPGVYAQFVADDSDGWQAAMTNVRQAMHDRNARMTRSMPVSMTSHGCAATGAFPSRNS